MKEFISRFSGNIKKYGPQAVTAVTLATGVSSCVDSNGWKGNMYVLPQVTFGLVEGKNNTIISHVDAAGDDRVKYESYQDEKNKNVKDPKTLDGCIYTKSPLGYSLVHETTSREIILDGSNDNIMVMSPDKTKDSSVHKNTLKPIIDDDTVYIKNNTIYLGKNAENNTIFCPPALPAKPDAKE